MLVFVAVLFFLLTPGVLVRLPPKCTLLTCAAFHAVVFTIVYFLGCKFLWNLLKNEGMENNENLQEGLPANTMKNNKK
jgi:putative Mn2+ efflux pump MntP